MLQEMHFQSKTLKTYLLGNDIFVAPVVDETGTVNMDFPDGTWVYAFDTSQTYVGGESLELTVALAHYPLFFREGAPVGDIITEGIKDLR